MSVRAMKRKAGSILLIVALLAQVPCRATESAAGARARIWADAADAQFVDALRRAAVAAGARVRVVRTGEETLLELSAPTSGQLRRALAAVASQAGAAGVKVRVALADSAEQAKAVSARGASIDPPRRACVRIPAAVVPAAAPGPVMARWSGPAWADQPACCPAVCVGGWGLRGPPV